MKAESTTVVSANIDSTNINSTSSVSNSVANKSEAKITSTTTPAFVRKIWSTPGGVHPPEHKDQSLQLPLAELDIPAELIYPLSQHVGTAAQAAVNVGDRVLTGQLIATAEDNISANIHAASSGIVTAIEPRPLPHASGLHGTSIVIETDGKDEWIALQPCHDYRKLQPIVLLEKIKAAGVIGMGGAGFPTAVKLAPNLPIATLIINGTECEPYITSDDMLMRTQPDDIVAGAMMLSYLLGKPKEILLAIEDNKPQAIEIMRKAVAASDLARNRMEVVPIPTKYPSGGEKQLVQTLTGKEVPSGRLPAHVGAMCQNVASVVAAYRAVTLGEPLISRITTVTGDAFEAQRNIKVRLGTPIHHILRTHGYDAKKASRLVMGGPMMGFTLLSDRAPVIKTTNCLLAPSTAEAPPPQPAQACIRCGMCAEACPASLLPQQLYWYSRAQDFDKLQSHHLFDCIECGACSYACPSHIPLVQYYRAAKGEIRQHQLEKIQSDKSRQRFEFHKDRIEKEKQERIRAREEAAAKAKQRKAEKELEQANSSNSPATAASSSVDTAEQKAKLERTLLSNEDKLSKLKQLLLETADSSPAKADTVRAQIKGVELKIQNLQQKISELSAGEISGTQTGISTQDQPSVAGTADAQKPSTDFVGSNPSQGASLAVLQLRERIAEVQLKLNDAQVEGNAESVTAFNMSLNILQQRLRETEQKDQGSKIQNTVNPKQRDATKSAVERAMERILDDRTKSDVNDLRQHIESLQKRLQQAQNFLEQTPRGDKKQVAELTQAVEQLETKLTSAFEQATAIEQNNAGNDSNDSNR